MDFSKTTEQTEASLLARTIFKDLCTAERLAKLDIDSRNGAAKIDYELNKALAEAGLLGLAVSEENQGAGLSWLENCSVLEAGGKYLAALPLAEQLTANNLLSDFGTSETKETLIASLSGSCLITIAISEPLAPAPAKPKVSATETASNWEISGTKTVVPAGMGATHALVSATTAAGVSAFLVDLAATGVTRSKQRTSDNDETAEVIFANAVGVPLTSGSGLALLERYQLALSAFQLGVLKGAQKLTAEYAKTREQFGRPIGTFQAVSQRLADGYIDILGAELTLWQAAWRVASGLPATEQIATAKLWAADAGHKVAHTTVHVHGGVGIDLDGEAHRYFTMAKKLEFFGGGTTTQAKTIGKLLANQ